jgi:energy-converting hydrogenase Eha subunit E
MTSAMAAIEPESTTVIIGRMLTPAFMINAAALLLLSLHNKFSTLSSRIRALNTERRNVESGQDPAKAERKVNLSRQIERLGKRLKYVRRAILFHYTGIALFLLTSFLIALNMLLKHPIVAVVDVAVFTLGMLSVFLGTVSHLRDVRTGFNAIRLEAPDAFK